MEGSALHAASKPHLETFRFYFSFCDRVFLCSTGRPQTLCAPALASGVLEIEVHHTQSEYLPSVLLFFPLLSGLFVF